MTRVVALVFLVGLASCTTKRHAAIGTAAGVGMLVAGIALLESGDSGASFSFTTPQAAGLIVGGALIAMAIYGAVPASRTPFRPTPDPAPPTEHCGVDNSCVPIGPRPPPQQPE